MEVKHASRETLVRRHSAGRDDNCERHGSLTLANGVESDTSDFFSCNICYDPVVDPVVTQCGHLYCWPCLHRWLKVQRDTYTCPVCKAGVERTKVIPIYGRGSEAVDPRLRHSPEGDEDQEEEEIPSRPLAQRLAPVPRAQAPQDPAQQAQQGLGIMPALFGMQLGSNGTNELLTQEQQHQAFLSRLLLMLGSFVIMCLLLF